MVFTLKQQKKQLRSKLIARRNAIDLATRKVAARDAATLLSQSSLFQRSQTIACYFASRHEFDCQSIIEKIWQANKQCVLPVIKSDDKKLQFVPYGRDSLLRPNQFNILEPVSKIIISLESLNLVILPLVGFDLSGNRLGMGAGYYDHTFANHKKIILIGLGFDEQQTTRLPVDNLDIPLHGVLTQSRLLLFN